MQTLDKQMNLTRRTQGPGVKSSVTKSKAKYIMIQTSVHLQVELSFDLNQL